MFMCIEKLRETVKDWSCGAIMMAINEELYKADSLEKKVELLAFKCEILEGSTYGKIRSVHKDF